MIDEAARRCADGENAPLAIETSGHAAFRENYFLDDGAYLVTRIIIKLCLLKRAGGGLGDLIADLEEPAEEKEVRLGITAPGNFESAVSGGNRKMAKTLLGWLSDADGLNLLPLQQFSEDFEKSY